MSGGSQPTRSIGLESMLGSLSFDFAVVTSATPARPWLIIPPNTMPVYEKTYAGWMEMWGWKPGSLPGRGTLEAFPGPQHGIIVASPPQ